MRTFEIVYRRPLPGETAEFLYLVCKDKNNYKINSYYTYEKIYYYHFIVKLLEHEKEYLVDVYDTGITKDELSDCLWSYFHTKKGTPPPKWKSACTTLVLVKP